MVVALWSWRYGRGAMVVALWSWRYGCLRLKPPALERHSKRLAGDVGKNAAQIVCKTRTITGIDPVVIIKFVMVSARWCCDPHFLERRLTVDHDMGFLIEYNGEHLAAATGIKINIQGFKPIVDLLVDLVQDGICACKKF